MVAPGARRAARAREVLRAALVLAALVAVAFADVLFGGRTLSPASYVPGVLPSGPVGALAPPLPPPLRDLEGGAWVDEPAPYLIHRPLAELRVPSWNAGVGLGAPLAANPNMAAWSPLQLVVNLWPTPLVQDLAWIARVYLLALFTFVLAHALGCGFLPSLVAATALALSGQTLDWLVHHPLNTDVFVPAALAASLWLLRGRTGARYALVLAVAAALLGVKPQSALTSALFGALLLAAVAWDERLLATRDRTGRVVRLVASVLLGAVLAGVALVPFLESYGAASGLVRAGRSTQSEWSLPLATLPDLIGSWTRSLMTGTPSGALRGPPHAGLSVLLLAFAGFWRARRRAVAWLLAASVVIYVARIFGLLPIPLAGLPVLGSVSFVKYCFPLYLALALLAALALAPDADRGATPSRGTDGAASRAPLLALLVVVAELLWLGARARPPRLDPYAPAPYVATLRELVARDGGRISGPVDLAPPLVSAVLGFRDLRAIDVLTPRDGYEFVSQLVAPSEGVTWILADPDPLVAATAPGAATADLRWILSREELRADLLDGAVRSAIAGRRLLRLFGTLDRYRIDTASLGGGLRELDGDRRFHWSCALPCRITLDLEQAPRRFVVGLAAAEALQARVELTLQASGADERSASADVALGPDAPWRDVWLDGTLDDTARAVTGAARVVVEIDGDAPGTVFVGGIGPGPGAAEEEQEARAELEFRTRALAGLAQHDGGEGVRIYENPEALGEAYLATDVAPARDLDEVRACLRAHVGRGVACVPDPATLPEVPSGAEADASARPGTVRIVASTDDRLEVDVDVARDALLVVSRLDFPGWQASVDGTRTTITRVNGALMGIVVPRGSHRVEVRYAPRSLPLGAAVSLLGLVALVASRRWFEGPRGRR